MNKINVNELKKGDILYKATDIGVIPNRIKDIDTESGYNAKIIFENGIIEELTKRTDSRSTGNKKPYFLTQEEAERYIYNNEQNKIKKKKMFEYEKKINKELGIETFLIKY